MIDVEVEQALGPGIDYEVDPRAGLVGRRVRPAGPWLGFDRAALVDSDDGSGRRVPVIVAVPGSTFIGARLETELVGGWRVHNRVILVARVAGGSTVMPALARIAARVDERATWLAPDAADLEALRARQRYRERVSHARIRGGRAWHTIDALAPEQARFETPHSRAEYTLARLPHRFVRGLEGLLDDDERVLYWVERPLGADQGIVTRLRRQRDPRAALLALTDKQLLWIVDHAKPDRYLADWGVDVELMPIERITNVSSAVSGPIVTLTVTTPAGGRAYSLPAELTAEVRTMRDLVARFIPSRDQWLPRRRYHIEAIPVDWEAADRFGQEPEARALHDAAAKRAGVIAFLFSPRRPGQRRPMAMVLDSTAVSVHTPDSRLDLPLGGALTVSLTLSPLVGRLSVEPGIRISYPAPLIDRGAAFVRIVRRAVAMAP